VNRLH